MKRKLAGFGLAFAGAELFAAAMPSPVLLPAAVFLVAALAFIWRRAARPALLGAFCGILYFAAFTALTMLPLQRYEGETALCTAVAGTDCSPSYAEGKMSGTIRITSVDGRPANFTAYCTNFPGLEPGERFTANLSLSALKEDRYRLSRLARGVRMLAEYEDGYTLLGESKAVPILLYRLRQTLSARLRSRMPRALGGMEAAMLLGDKKALGDNEAKLFRTAGVSHLLAVSGLHVTLLCGLVFGRQKKKRFYRPILAAQGVLAVFYMLLTGAPVSVLRAGLVFLLALVGYWFLQPVDLLTSTGTAALLLGLQNAYAPCDLGFQLSFAAVLGVQGATTLTAWERKRIYTPEPETVKQHAGNLALRGLSNVQVAAFAAVATTPVLVAHGLGTSGVGVLCNLLVVWMLRPALLLGMSVLGLGLVPVLAPLAHMASFLLSLLLHLMLTAVTWCAGLPMAHLYLPPRYTLVIFALLGALAAIFWYRKKFRWYWPVAAAMVACAVCVYGISEKGVVRVALVGTAGNPCAVCTQEGKAVVFFRGGASNERAVEDYLEEHGAPHTELLVDLRQKGEKAALPAENALQMQALTRDTTVPALDNVALTLYHRSSGNLAVIDTGAVELGMMAGNIKLDEPVTVDVFCAAGALSDSVMADAIVYTAASPKWLDKVGDAVLYQGTETPTIVLRPKKNAAFEEVRKIALQ